MREDFIKQFEPIESRKDESGNIHFSLLNQHYMLFTMGKPLGWRYEYAAERIGQVCLTNADALVHDQGDIKAMTDLLLSKISVMDGQNGTPLNSESFDEHVGTFPAFENKVSRSAIPKLFFLAVCKVVHPEQYDFFFGKTWGELSQTLKGQSAQPSDSETVGMMKEKTPSDNAAQT